MHTRYTSSQTRKKKQKLCIWGKRVGRTSLSYRELQMAPPPKSSNTKTERVEQQTERSNLSLEEMEQEDAPPKQKSKARKKRPRYYTAVRRSSRIRNTVTPTQNRSLAPVEITISESESERDKEYEPPLLEENEVEPAIRGVKTLDEKVDYAIQLLETMSSQGNNRGSDSSELRYRSLYFDSQKQNEALKKENRELSLKLEVALAKIEGFEKGNHASVEWMAKFKDVLLVTSLAKASEMANSPISRSESCCFFKEKETSLKEKRR